MSEDKKTMEMDAAQQDYVASFTPTVHKIGRITMACAFVLAFLPVIYLLFKGYGMPLSSYINVIIAVSSIGIGMWLTEPLAYWPVLGSAGTYMGYLSGNVGAMRFPVALSVQSAMDANINTPRGQVATIVGIAASIVSNLVILLIVVLSGTWIINALPAAVIEAFAYVMPTLMGSMLMMRFNGKDGIAKGILAGLPYLAVAVVCKLIITNYLKVIANYGMAVTVALCILAGYVLYRRDCAKDAKKA